MHTVTVVTPTCLVGCTREIAKFAGIIPTAAIASEASNDTSTRLLKCPFIRSTMTSHEMGMLSIQLPFLVIRISLAKVLSAALLVFVVDRIGTFQRKRRVSFLFFLSPSNTHRLAQALNYLPGVRSAFSPMGLVGALMKTRSWQAGLDFTWERRQECVFPPSSRHL